MILLSINIALRVKRIWYMQKDKSLNSVQVFFFSIYEINIQLL